MKKILFTAIFLSVCILGTHGQVETTFFPNRDALQQNRLLKEHRRVAKIKAMPPLDIQKIASARQQEKDDNVPFRFGEGFDTHITLADGEWTDRESGRLWTMAIESKGAYSINFVFNDFHLPEGAELYISNEEGDMLYGPVTSKVNTENGHFLTDLIKGDKVTIYLFEPSNKRNESQLTIKRVVHAYLDLYGNLDRSLDCNNNIACFPVWSKESDAVALVLLSNGAELCSGSLLMTANLSFRPYFLSAFHCIDTDLPNGSLSSSEISNAENWMFKFQYKMSSCSGGHVTSGVTYNRATFRAAWNNTDFALMELRNSPAGDSRFSWLGWDRSGNAPTSGTGIHHPSGDVMKISFDNDQLQISSWGGNNNHWLISFDDGVVQHGSSGSPLFNQNKQVVGQLHGNQSYNSSLPYCEQPRAEYGQFHRSWTGGGTNSTRLSNWLDPNGSDVMTTNTSKYPSLSGPSSFYNEATYTVENLPVGSSVQWSSSSNCLRLISGQGTATATFKAIFNTSAVITATISGPTSTSLSTGTITANASYNSDISFDVWNNSSGGYIGNTATGTSGLCPNTTYHFSLVNNSGCALSDLEWTVSPAWTIYYTQNNMISINTNQAAGGWISLKARTCCGTSGTVCSATLGSSSDCSNYRFTLSPNPATDEVTLQLTETDEVSGLSVLSTDRTSYEIQLWSGMRMLKSFKTDQPTFSIPMAGLPAGLYFVRVVKDGQTHTQKLIKK